VKTYLPKLLIPVLLISFFAPFMVEGYIVRIENPLQAKNFWELIDKIVDFIFNISLWIAPTIIIVAGYYFITAMGQPEKIITAKKIIIWTLIVLVIVFSAKGLIKLFQDIFEVGPPTP